MTALALHPVEAAAGCDLFEEGAAPFALFVGRPEAPVPVEVVTGRAEAAAVPRLWEAMDAAYRQSGGTFWLLARQRLWRGAREVRCPHAEAVDARVLRTGMTVYSTAPVEEARGVMLFVRTAGGVRRSVSFEERRTKRMAERARHAHPEADVVAMALRWSVFWHIHM
ncbi:MAG TPA: hypothetical protein RMH85_04220 [Polyangiaceae bacterium LLY-WYZ-15_(1-7)]|nr:hypothetical protein [Myxococcales bacterium]MAT24083.1 hypothetical protein [Sandaracinus sp.]HJL03938.1 hypothetical protein [Polyangiaceae bacterium LLY-WYZ-15_(1-7)]MBJ70941.1 hypothetical protein [Sandaracinus sp.]HJL07674.1 hypothetical protein [Polyangiaceae bacterium LLY-WYZ-15_(1-7)]